MLAPVGRLSSALFWQLKRLFISFKGCRLLAFIQGTRGARLCQPLCLPVHFWSPLRLRVLEDLWVLCTGSTRSRKNVPAAPMGLPLLKDLYVPVSDSHRARVFVPGVVLCPRPLEDRACPPLAEKAYRCPFNLSRTDPSRTPSTIFSRSTLAAASAPCVRVTFPAGGAPPPARPPP